MLTYIFSLQFCYIFLTLLVEKICINIKTFYPRLEISLRQREIQIQPNQHVLVTGDFAAFNEISATCFTPKINITSQKIILGVYLSHLLLKPSCLLLKTILTGLQIENVQTTIQIMHTVPLILPSVSHK